MSIHDYGMFTESGNILVGGIVDTAIVNNFDYIWVKNYENELKNIRPV